jgi:hypothetical protein
MIFAPPSFIVVSHYAMGYHSESVLFTLGQMALTLAYLKNPQKKYAFAFGVLSGLGFWYTYITGISALACLLALMTDRAARRSLIQGRAAVWGVLGGFSGLLPWILYNLTHRLEGVAFLYYSFGSGGFSGLLKGNEAGRRLVQLWTVSLPQNYHFPDFLFLPSQVLNYAYLLASLALGMLYGLRPPQRVSPVFKISVFYALLFSVIYALSGHEVFTWAPVDSRYFVPLVFMMLLAVSLPSEAPSKLLTALRILLILLGIAGQSVLWFQSPWASALRF